MREFLILGVKQLAKACPHCGQPAKVPAIQAEFELACPHCDRSFRLVQALNITAPAEQPEAEGRKG